MKSIQAKLSIGLFISLLSVFFILWLIISYSIQQLAESYTASRLEHDIETLLTAIIFDPNNHISLNQEKINSIYKRPFSGHYYTIKYKNKMLRSRSLWDQQLNINTINAKQYTRSKQFGPEHQPLIIISRAFNKQGQQIAISVAEDLTAVILNIQYFKKVFALTAIISLLILLIIQKMILRKGLYPLQEIQQQLKSLEQGQITKLNSKVPTELKPLTLEINHLLSILHKRLDRSRHALSDLSHAIKKPLTILGQLSEQKDAIQEIAAEKILTTQIKIIHQLTDRILKRARLSGKIQTGSLFNFNTEIEILIKTIKMMYPQKNVSITTSINISVPAHFDREDMLELLGNLLDNAYKWAKKEIHLSVDKMQDWHFIIEDDGQGCSQVALEQLPMRGTRLDETTHGDGFGLAIAYDIVTDYEGEMRFSKSQLLGGFKVSIKLPN